MSNPSSITESAQAKANRIACEAGWLLEKVRGLAHMTSAEPEVDEPLGRDPKATPSPIRVAQQHTLTYLEAIEKALTKLEKDIGTPKP